VFHKHHIIPKHAGGIDDDSNIIELTIEKHAEAHLKLFEEYGNKFDYIAYMALSGQITMGEAGYLKLLGPKNWTEEGKETLRQLGKLRTGKQNTFYNKHHTEETKQILREKLSGNNSWIKDIDPAKLPYTKNYKITYPSGKTKEVSGLKIIAKEFGTSIVNVHATIGRIAKGKLPRRGIFADVLIKEIL